MSSLLKIKKLSLSLIVIFLIALFLRLINLPNIPVGLHGDEVSIGYNAYSLLKTGRDQDGHLLPLSFDQFGDFRAAGYQYIDIPFIVLFGLNAFAVRLPAALFGAFTIIVFYFLVLELFENKQVSLLASFLLAILPWHVNISRASSEGVISSFFIILGIYLLYKAIKQTPFKISLFVYSFLSLLTSIFFYHAARFFIPAFLPFLFAFGFLRYRRTKEKTIGSIVLYIALVIGLLLFLTVGRGSARVSQVSLFNIPGGTKEVKQFMDEDGKQIPEITRFFHNKLYFYGRLFLTFYSQHFSGDFLFVNNGNPIRYKLLNTGNLYLIQAPFLLLGLAVLLVEGIKQKKYLFFIPLAWLLIGALPAALTWEDLPNVIRANLMIPPLVIITAFGFYEALQLTKGTIRQIFIVVCVLILLQNITIFLHNYFYHSKIHEPWYRSAAEEELIYSIKELDKGGQKIVMTTQNNNNLIFYLFYTKFDPRKFQEMGSPREKDDLHFGNFVYKYNPCPIEGDPNIDALGNIGDIFVDKPECKLPKNAEVLKIIKTPDGLPAFQIVLLHTKLSP